MVEVVPDSSRLPVDPDVRVPDSVKRRAAAVDAYYAQQTGAQTNGQPAPPVVQPAASSTPTPQATPPETRLAPVVAPPAEIPAFLPPRVAPAAPAVSAAPAAPAAPTPSLDRQQPGEPVDPNDLTWQGRFLAMQGRYEGAQKIVGEMQEQLAQMGDELIRVQQTVRAAPPKPPPQPRHYLTEQDVQNYGTDLVDFTQRAAIQAVTPRLEYMQKENEDLRIQVAREAKLRLDMVLDIRVPKWREINNNPQFHAWLRLPDVYSGQVRQALLDDAVASSNAPRVISFFEGFLREGGATSYQPPAPTPDAKPPRETAVPLAMLAAPGGARPATGGESSMPPERPIYTRAQIADLYRAHRKGAYVGREAEWDRQELDIIAAGREGRVIG